MKTPTIRYNAALILIAIASVTVLLSAPWIGMENVGWRDVFAGGDPLRGDIFWKLRFPRALVGFLAGCGLGIGGAVFQALFQNPLAEPFTLGVSSGASAGVVLAIYLGGGMVAGGILTSQNLFAFAGALLAIGAVYAFSKKRRDNAPANILLAGVMVNFFFSSLIMLVQHFVDPNNAARMLRAMIGGVAGAGRGQLTVIVPFVLVGAAGAGAYWRELDIMSFGEELALSRGVDTGRVRRRLYLVVSLMVGGITAVCGPVGFVGLVAPHMCRFFVGPGHGRLLAAAGLFGGAFLVGADAVARIVVAPAEIPVGVLCSLCGAPFFLWLLMRNGKNTR